MTVVTVISILALASLAWLSPGLSNTRVKARDTERRNDTSSIARLLEQYYRNKRDSSGASYPIANASTVDEITTLARSNDILRAPEKATPSLQMAVDTLTPAPNKDYYVYQPFTASDSLCTVRPCVRYTLYYTDESTNTVKRIESSHQQ